MEIRDSRLYRDTHKTFELYCRDRWGFTKTRANQLIGAAAVSESLATTVVKPLSERQARPLTALPPKQQVEAWNEAVDAAPDGMPTAEQIQKIVDSKRKDISGLRRRPVQGSQALYLAEVAINQLKRIEANDPKKLEAGVILMEWIIFNIFGGFEGHMEYIHSPEAKKAARRRSSRNPHGKETPSRWR